MEEAPKPKEDSYSPNMLKEINVIEDATVEKILPGFVVLRKILDEKDQRTMVMFANKVGSGKIGTKNSFWLENNGKKFLNLGSRGRIYDCLKNYEEGSDLANLCKNLVKVARKQDETIPDTNPTHLISLRYEGDKGIVWHKDDDINDGEGDAPVVSFSLGNSCHFGYKVKGQEKSVYLESGDVVLFGGPSRMIEHNVMKVYVGTAPEFLSDLLGSTEIRFNFTFRQTPKMVGKESEFQIQDY